MSLYIRNEETCRLARELAAVMGETITEAVTVALRERLALLDGQPVNPRAGLAARLLKISEETAPLMNDGRSSKELSHELYDEETGLPK